jgi:hypothetical protein
MDYKAKLNILRGEIDCTIKYFSHKQSKTKHRANIVKISSVCFSAAITVILGLNSARDTSELFINIALVLGSVVTIINAVDAFYGFNSLWIKNTVTLAKLRELKRKVEFYGAGRENEDISEDGLSKFLEEFHQILKDDINQWLRIREKVNSVEKGKDSDGLSEIQYRNIEEKINRVTK